MSHILKKPVLAICEHKGADQPAHAGLSYLVRNPEDRFSRDKAPILDYMWRKMVFSTGKYFLHINEPGHVKRLLITISIQLRLGQAFTSPESLQSLCII